MVARREVSYRSPLHEMTQTTPTCLWNDSADIDELNYAIDNGAVGATCNPVIAVTILKKHITEWRPRIQSLLSRTRAKQIFTWDEARAFLRDRGVTLISAGLDEVPMAYKDIDEVMAAQSDLVEPLARFEPRLVKMAPSGEPAED